MQGSQRDDTLNPGWFTLLDGQDRFQRDCEIVPLTRDLAHALEDEKCGVAFVDMPYRRAYAERRQGATHGVGMPDPRTNLLHAQPALGRLGR